MTTLFELQVWLDRHKAQARTDTRTANLYSQIQGIVMQRGNRDALSIMPASFWRRRRSG